MPRAASGGIAMIAGRIDPAAGKPDNVRKAMTHRIRIFGCVFSENPRRVFRYALLLLALCTMPLRLGAGELTELQVTETEGVYHVKMVMLLQAPENHVRAVLTDYAHIYRLNPSITESGILPSPGQGVARVRTLMTGCIAFFCRHVERAEDVRQLASGDLRAEIVPELSDLRSGRAEWKIQARGEHSQVTYEAYMEPDFFIPPVIGSYFVKKNIHKEIMTTFTRLECVAQIQARRDGNPRLRLASLRSEPVCGDPCDTPVTECRQ
jgi:hypothetical protein